MTKVLLLHNIFVHDKTTIKEIRDPIAPLIGPHTNHSIDMNLVKDINRVHILEITMLTGIHLHLDHLQGEEVLDFLDLAHI